MDPTKSEMSLAEMDYKGAFSKGRLYLSSSACAQFLPSELPFPGEERTKPRCGFASSTAMNDILSISQPCKTMCSGTVFCHPHTLSPSQTIQTLLSTDSHVVQHIWL